MCYRGCKYEDKAKEFKGACVLPSGTPCPPDSLADKNKSVHLSEKKLKSPDKGKKISSLYKFSLVEDGLEIDLAKCDFNKKYRLEGDLNKEVKKLFKFFEPDLQAVRKEQGQYCSQAGVHDWLLCWKGIAGSVELKSKKGKPSKLQLKWGREGEAAGRIIGYVQTLNDVLEVIKKLETKYTILIS